MLPTDSGFGARLLELCNQGLFECLALNLHCLGGQQMELAAVINGRIVSITQPLIPSLLLFSQVFFGILQVFFLQTATLYAFVPFKGQLRVLFQVCFLPPASHVSWSESVLGELADDYDGTEAAGGTGTHACRP